MQLDTRYTRLAVMPQKVTPRGLFRWAIVLLVFAALVRALLPTAVVFSLGPLPHDQRSTSLVWLLIELVASLALPIGATLLGAALVLQGLRGMEVGLRQSRTGDGAS